MYGILKIYFGYKVYNYFKFNLYIFTLQLLEYALTMTARTPNDIEDSPCADHRKEHSRDLKPRTCQQPADSQHRGYRCTSHRQLENKHLTLSLSLI